MATRTFFAVWPDEAAARRLHDIAAEAQKTCGGRAMARPTLHVTLAFLGDLAEDRLAEARRVADTLAGEPFDLALDRLGYWRHNRIFWAGGGAPRLTLLAHALQDGLRAAGFRLDRRPFVAHLTLLRDARCAGVPILAEPVAWPVSEFVLVESRRSGEGARYAAIGRWPLGATGAG